LFRTFNATGFTTTLGGDLPPSSGARTAELRGVRSVVPVADLDGDGHPELLLGGFVAEQQPGAPYPTQGDPASYLVFSGGGETAITGLSNRPTGTAGDLDGDGRPELLLTGEGGGSVLFGRATNTPAVALADTAAIGLDGVPVQVDEPLAALRAMPDLGGDGRPESLAEASGGTTYVLFKDPLWAS